jgi:hypothetical protein
MIHDITIWTFKWQPRPIDETHLDSHTNIPHFINLKTAGTLILLILWQQYGILCILSLGDYDSDYFM